MLSERRDKHAARRFLRRLVEITERKPARITTDLHPAYRRAIRWIIGRKAWHRTTQYLNNYTEQSHRAVKQRYYPMQGFGSFESASRPSVARSMSCDSTSASRPPRWRPCRVDRAATALPHTLALADQRTGCSIDHQRRRLVAPKGRRALRSDTAQEVHPLCCQICCQMLSASDQSAVIRSGHGAHRSAASIRRSSVGRGRMLHHEH